MLFALTGLGAVGSALGGSQPAHGMAALNADGTPAAGDPLVIEAETRTRDATPRGDQTLRLAGPSDDLRSLDPALVRDLATQFICRQLFRGLVRLDADMEPVPDLADRIEISADGRLYTVRLRPDAVFHDGRAIRASDVVASLTRALLPGTAGGDADLLGGPTYLGDIAGSADLLVGRTTVLRGARAVGPRTVELRLSTPRATFLMKLAGVPAAIVDSSQVGSDTEWWRSPNGSGPFRLEAWDADNRIVLVPHAGYPQPAVARVEILLGSSATQPFNLYQNDQIDVVGVPPSSIDRVADPAGPLAADLRRTPRLSVSYVAFRTDTPPMDDPHLRRAVRLAFPADKVAEVSFDGHRLVADGIIPPGTLGRSWPVDTLPYDRDAARREVAASTYGRAENVPPIMIFGAATPGAEALRDVLAADLGLRVEVVSVDWPEFNDGLHRRLYPAYELYWGADYPDPESFLWSLFASGAPDNYIGYQNEAVDGPLREAATVIGLDERAALYELAHQALVDDDAVIPLFHDVGYTLVGSSVHGLDITPMGILGLEDVWLER